MDGLHLGIDDHAHVVLAHALTIELLDQPGAVHGIQVVALEDHEHCPLGVHQIQVLRIVLRLQGESAHLGKGVHDGLLVGDVAARLAGGDEIGELDVVTAQLEGAVDGVAAIAAVHLVTARKVEVQVGAFHGIDLLLAQDHDIPLAIELLGGIGDFDIAHGLLHMGNDVLYIHATLLQLLVLLLAGIHRGGSHQHRQQEGYDNIFSHRYYLIVSI